MKLTVKIDGIETSAVIDDNLIDPSELEGFGLSIDQLEVNEKILQQSALVLLQQVLHERKKDRANSGR